MSNLYRNPNWIVFRQQIIEADGEACVICGRDSNEVILQVHHKKYQQGKLPWEYPPKLCETLCSGCHARCHGKIRPNNGWDLLFQNDLQALVGECDLCKTILRYEFHIHHPSWEPMIVGTDCCDNLTGTSLASDYRKSLGRKQRFLNSPKWKSFSKGKFLKKKGLVIKILLEERNYRIHVNNLEGKHLYSDIDDAKAKIFELIENGKIEQYSR